MSESYTFKIPENTINIDSSKQMTEAYSGVSKERPTICFATMCKNEEHCIRETLESVYKYIDYWVVGDTGSTDRTCEIVTEFFKEKNIPGELHVDEWVGFDKNKTKLFNYCYKKADYILHLDADDLLDGDFSFTKEDGGCLQYHSWARRGEKSSFRYKILLMFYNHVHWKFCGVAHTTIRCLDSYSLKETGDLTHKNFVMISRDSGARANDPEKYKKDALRLTDQFFDTLIDDPDSLNNRSVFYTAQSYNDCSDLINSARWYSLYLKLQNTWFEEQYESHLKLASIFQRLDRSVKQVEDHFFKAMAIVPDRAEAYMYLGKYYNEKKMWEKGYEMLKKGMNTDYSVVKTKYFLFLNEKAYGKYLIDELAVSCYWTGRFQESVDFIKSIIDDPDMVNHRERLEKNIQFAVEAMEKNK